MGAPVNFYPRPPRGGRLGWCDVVDLQVLFLSTPSARRATKNCITIFNGLVISIPAPREEGDPRTADSGSTGNVFLSTPSARRATTGREHDRLQRRYFYPRPPRGGRRRNTSRTPWRPYFYPRPPRGGRHTIRARARDLEHFYPRPPRGGRPKSGSGDATTFLFLSTPSARRATTRPMRCTSSAQNFYPRPPRGGRLR